MIHPDYDYDEIADKIFFPIYDTISDRIIEKCGITRGKMLDIGSGGGHLGFALMEKTELEGYMADIKEAAVEIASMRAGERGLSERTQCGVQDVHCMTLEDNWADIIISRGSYLFWSNQEKAFKEIYRVLAPGGMTYIGAGLGSKEQHEVIHRKMVERNPNWESPCRKDNFALDTEEYEAMFSSFGWDFEIIDGDEGRWMIIRKPEN